MSSKIMPSTSNIYKAVVVDVVDGDTLVLDVDLGMYVSHRARVRLRGVYAPEIGSEAGQKCKDRLASLCPVGCGVILKSYKTERYGRWVGEVWVGGQYVNEIIQQYIYSLV